MAVATIAYNGVTAESPDAITATVIFSVNNISNFLGVPPGIQPSVPLPQHTTLDGTPAAFGNEMTRWNVYNVTGGEM